MKQIATIMSLLFLVPMINLAQDKEMKKLFNQFKNKPGFALEIEDSNIDMDYDGDFDMFDFLDKVEDIYILNFEKNKGAVADLNRLKAKLDKHIDRKAYKSMLDISGDGTVRILTRKIDGKTTDFLLITEDEEDAMFFWAGS